MTVFSGLCAFPLTPTDGQGQIIATDLRPILPLPQAARDRLAAALVALGVNAPG